MNTLIPFSKIVKAELIWVNQFNNIVLRSKPPCPTVSGVPILEKEYAAYHEAYPLETLTERARRLDLLDRFEPVFKAFLYSGHRYEVAGKKAIEMWAGYRAFVFGKSKYKK